MVDVPPVARSAAGGVRHLDGRPHRRRPRQGAAGRAAGVRGRRLPGAAGAEPDPPGDQPEPGLSDIGLAVRSADRGLRRPARHRPPRRPLDDHRSDGGARVRSGDDRASAERLDGLHRQRPHHPRDRRRLDGGGRGVELVGRHHPRRRLGLHPLAAARERRLARPQHARGAGGAARRRLRLSPGRRSAGGQGAAPVRAGDLDARPLHGPAHAAARAAVCSDAHAPATPRRLHPAGDRRQPPGLLAHRPRRAGAPDRPRTGGDLPPERGRGVGDRFRRPELGAGRRFGAGRGGGAPEGGCRAHRRLALGPAQGARACRRARSGSAM